LRNIRGNSFTCQLNNDACDDLGGLVDFINPCCENACKNPSAIPSRPALSA
jgi:hypothetical protein